MEYIGEIGITHVREVNPQSRVNRITEQTAINRDGIGTSKKDNGLDTIKIYGYTTSDVLKEDLESLMKTNKVQCYYERINGFIEVVSVDFSAEREAIGIRAFSLTGKLWPESVYYESFDLNPNSLNGYDRILVLPQRQAYIWTAQGYTLSFGHKVSNYVYLHQIAYSTTQQLIKYRYEKNLDRFKTKVFDGTRRVFNTEHKFTGDIIIENISVRWNLSTGALTSKLNTFAAVLKPTNVHMAPVEYVVDNITPEEIRVIQYVGNQMSMIYVNIMDIKVHPEGVEWSCVYPDETDIVTLSHDGHLINHSDTVGTIVNVALPSVHGFTTDIIFSFCHFVKVMDTDPLKTEMQNMYLDVDKVINVDVYSDSMYMKSIGKFRYLSSRGDV